MKEIIRKYIRKVITESGGKQDEIYNFSSEITGDIINYFTEYMKQYKDRMLDGSPWEFTIPKVPTEQIKITTLIRQIIIDVNYTHSSQNKITGKLKRIKLLDSDYYRVNLEMDIIINDDIDNHFKQIEYWITHELHHAFRYIRTINKNSKANKLNFVKNKTARFTSDFLQKYPPLKEFIDMIYLSLPQEVEARAQETATQLKYNKSTNPNQVYKYLMQFHPINDSRKMLNYSTEEVLKIDKEISEKFIDIFNLNLKELGLNTWEKKDVNAFFEFWRKKIIEAGENLQRLIDRMISDKLLYENEYKMFNDTDLNILTEAYGIDFGDIFC